MRAGLICVGVLLVCTTLFCVPSVGKGVDAEGRLEATRLRDTLCERLSPEELDRAFAIPPDCKDRRDFVWRQLRPDLQLGYAGLYWIAQSLVFGTVLVAMGVMAGKPQTESQQPAAG